MIIREKKNGTPGKAFGQGLGGGLCLPVVKRYKYDTNMLMKLMRILCYIGLVAGLGLFTLISTLGVQASPPNFAEIECPKARKSHFIKYFSDIIQVRNAAILKDRKRVKKLFAAYWAKKPPGGNDLKWLQEISSRYRLKNQDFRLPSAFNNLLIRVDALPEELILAQAGLESGWGTSRFAKEGHNYFGQWCFVAGCGIIPKKRAAGQSHEVQTFESPSDSLKSYIHNLNSHDAYISFRQVRKKMRQTNKPISGHELADELHLYATNQQYTELLQRVMRGINPGA